MPDPDHQNVDPNASDFVAENIDDDDIIADGLDSDEDEFSLDQLSAAYAQVLEEQNQVDDDSEALDRVTSVDDTKPMQEDRPLRRPDKLAAAGTGQTESEGQREQTAEPEDDDNRACPISPISILEAILFVGGPKEVKLNSKKIAALMRDVSPKEITSLVKTLNQSYENEKRAYRIVNNQGALRMELHPDMISVQNHMLGRNRATRLTQQAIDVLAIVAYNQPIPREQVDRIRAKPSASILSQMVRRDLLQLEIAEPKSRQKVYRTTGRFLDLFGLESVEDLPQSHDVSDIEELAD